MNTTSTTRCFKMMKMAAAIVVLFLGLNFKVHAAPAPGFTLASSITTSSSADRLGGGQAYDFTGDGFKDLLVNDEGGNVRLYVNNGDGTFPTTFTNTSTQSGDNIYAPHVGVGDFDGDGDLDFVAASGNNTNVRLFTNNGSGTFTKGTTNLWYGDGTASSIKVADVNGDGKLDFLMGNGQMTSNTYLQIWYNTTTSGNATFTHSTSTSILSSVYGTNTLWSQFVDVGDIDNDGDKDIIASSAGNGAVVYKNNGSNVFSVSQMPGEYSGGNILYDWNSDGFLDILVMETYNNNGIRVKLNDGTGNFVTPGVIILQHGFAAGSIRMADFNGDGRQDFIFSVWSSTPRIFVSSGCTDFAEIFSGISGNSSHGVLSADFNNDNKPDVFCQGRDNPSTIYLNGLSVATPPTTSSITSTTPGSRCGTGSVTLSAVASNGGSVTWYNAISGGSQVGSGSPFSTSSISSTTTFYAAATLNGCTSLRVPAIATIKANPTATFTNSGSNSFCAAEGVTLTASAGTSWLWSPGGETTQAITVNASGSYTVAVTNSVGCTVTSSASALTANATPTWYLDDDSDTYGTEAVSQTVCNQPSGFVSNNTDCNDNNSAVKPSATEVCNTIDDNCTGGTDEGVTNTYYQETVAG